LLTEGHLCKLKLERSRNLPHRFDAIIQDSWWNDDEFLVVCMPSAIYISVTTGFQRFSTVFNVIRTVARARVHRSGHLKGLKVWDYREHPAPSFLGISVKQPGANRSDRLECTELSGPRDENSTLSYLGAVSFALSRTKRSDRWWASFRLQDL